MSRQGTTVHRIILPCDAELWRKHRAGTLSLSNLVQCRNTRPVRAQLRERGWVFIRIGRGQYRPTHAPCEQCGSSFTLEEGQQQRLCTECLPPKGAEPWRIDLEYGRVIHQRRQAVREAQTHRLYQEQQARWPQPTLHEIVGLMCPRWREVA